MIVYLAGGMRSDWQERVKAAVPNHCYINPAQSGVTAPAQYTLWDMFGIERADLLFVYIEKDNPSGIGAAFEIGYALGLGKRVILVDRRSPRDELFRRYTAIVHQAGPIVLETLNDGITMLESLARLDELVGWSPGQVEAKKIWGERLSKLFSSPRGEVDCANPDTESTVWDVAR